MVKPCNAELSKGNAEQGDVVQGEGEAMPCRVMHSRGVAACCAAKLSEGEAVRS